MTHRDDHLELIPDYAAAWRSGIHKFNAVCDRIWISIIMTLHAMIVLAVIALLGWAAVVGVTEGSQAAMDLISTQLLRVWQWVWPYLETDPSIQWLMSWGDNS